MKIFSDNKLSYIDLTFQEILSEKAQRASGRTDIRLAVNVSCREFNGRNDHVWLGRSEIDRFLNDLHQFEKQRQGEVTLASLGAPSEYNDFSLRLYTTNSAGHIAAKVDLLRIQYLQDGDLCPLKVSVGFDIDAGYLSTFVAEFNELLNSQGVPPH